MLNMSEPYISVFQHGLLQVNDGPPIWLEDGIEPVAECLHVQADQVVILCSTPRGVHRHLEKVRYLVILVKYSRYSLRKAVDVSYLHLEDPSALCGAASVPLVVAVPRHEPLQFVVLGGELEKAVDDLRLARVQQRQKRRDLRVLTK